MGMIQRVPALGLSLPSDSELGEWLAIYQKAGLGTRASYRAGIRGLGVGGWGSGDGPNDPPLLAR